jgi:hypothetical protein
VLTLVFRAAEESQTKRRENSFSLKHCMLPKQRAKQEVKRKMQKGIKRLENQRSLLKQD